MSPSRFQHPAAVVRTVFATATVLFGVLGLLLREATLLVAAGACGMLWTAWDFLWARTLGPAAGWISRMFLEGVGGGPPPKTRPTLDDTIRLLESHLARDVSRGVAIQAAIRLEEIYRTVRQDPARARAVIERVRARYPDAPELIRFNDPAA